MSASKETEFVGDCNHIKRILNQPMSALLSVIHFLAHPSEFVVPSLHILFLRHMSKAVVLLSVYSYQSFTPLINLFTLQQ